MKSVYLDTGLVFKLIVWESLSEKVEDFVRQRAIAVPFTWLIETEISNALHAKRFREEINDRQLAASMTLITTLIDSGHFRRMPVAAEAVIAETLRLIPKLTPRTGCRTLDMMHLASIQLLGLKEFASSDRRQLSAARHLGLKVVDLKDV